MPRDAAGQREYFSTPKGRAVKLVSSARTRCKSSGLPVTITSEWVAERIRRGTCEVTGFRFDLEPTDERHDKRFAPSLHRVDVTKGYTEENTIVCVWIYNRALGQWSHQDLLDLCHAILKREGHPPYMGPSAECQHPAK